MKCAQGNYSTERDGFIDRRLFEEDFRVVKAILSLLGAAVYEIRAGNRVHCRYDGHHNQGDGDEVCAGYDAEFEQLKRTWQEPLRQSDHSAHPTHSKEASNPKGIDRLTRAPSLFISCDRLHWPSGSCEANLGGGGGGAPSLVTCSCRDSPLPLDLMYGSLVEASIPRLSISC